MTSEPPQSRARFLGGVLALSGGTALAQVIVVFTAPVLSRLFDPEAFGLLGLFSAVLGILTPFGGLMYYLALVLPKRDEEASDLFGLCLLFALGATGLLALALFFFGGTALELFGAGSIGPYQLLVAIAFLLVSLAAPLRTWNTRQQKFVRLGTVPIGSAALVAGVAIGAGWLGADSGRELILATVLGLGVPVVVLGVAFAREHGARLARTLSFEGMWRAARRYKNFPYFVTPTALLSVTTAEIPTMFLMGVFGASVTGFYTLARRATVSPLRVFGTAIAEVFFQRAGAASARDADLSGLVEGVAKRLITLAFLPALVLALCGPQLFTTVFGARWAEAGLFASLLALDLFGAFVGGSISRILLVLERQRLEVVLNVIAVSAAVAALALGGLVLGDPRAAILLFAVTGFALGIVRLVICVRLSGARGAVISRHVLRLLLYAAPTVALVLWARWAGARDLVVAAAAVLGCVPYGLLVLREDDELRGALLGFLRRSEKAG